MVRKPGRTQPPRRPAWRFLYQTGLTPPRPSSKTEPDCQEEIVAPGAPTPDLRAVLGADGACVVIDKNAGLLATPPPPWASD